MIHFIPQVKNRKEASAALEKLKEELMDLEFSFEYKQYSGYFAEAYGFDGDAYNFVKLVVEGSIGCMTDYSNKLNRAINNELEKRSGGISGKVRSHIAQSLSKDHYREEVLKSVYGKNPQLNPAVNALGMHELFKKTDKFLQNKYLE